MKKVGRLITIILVIAIVLGTVCAGVGILTGADIARVSAVIENRAAVKYNVDLDAFLHVWIPEVVRSFRQVL